MNGQTVQFVTCERTDALVRVNDAFAFNPRRGWAWLQHAALWVLRRLDCYYMEEQSSYSYHALHGPTFMERVYRQHQELRRTYGQKAVTLLMGAEDYAELMGGPEIRQYIELDLSGVTKVHGLELKIVPWMRGVVVLPRERTGRATTP
jgi:hypothetical protein